MRVGEREREGERGDTKGDTERQGREKEDAFAMQYIGATVNPMATCTLYLG